MFILYVWKVQTQLKEWPMKYWLRSLCTHLITHGGESPQKTDCAAHWEWCQNPLPSTGTRTGQISSASLGLQLAQKFQHLLQDPALCCAHRNALSRKAHVYKDPCCKGQLAGSGYPAEHSLDPTKNSSIPVVFILLSLSNVPAWAKVTAGNGQPCLVTLRGDGSWVVHFPCINMASYKTP